MIVLKRPIITEKSMKLSESGLYTFEVDKDANKPLVAKVVAEKFNVKVLGVKIINQKGEIKNQRQTRGSYRTKNIKKALVQLKKGDKIAIFEAPKVESEVTVTTGEGEPIRLREKKDLLGRTKVMVEKTVARSAGGAVGAAPTTQRKVITGK